MKLYHVVLRIGSRAQDFDRHCAARTPMAAFHHVVDANEIDADKVRGFEVKEIAASVDVDPTS